MIRTGAILFTLDEENLFYRYLDHFGIITYPSEREQDAHLGGQGRGHPGDCRKRRFSEAEHYRPVPVQLSEVGAARIGDPGS